MGTNSESHFFPGPEVSHCPNSLSTLGWAQKMQFAKVERLSNFGPDRYILIVEGKGIVGVPLFGALGIDSRQC
jgi:hypothetical protein